MFDLAAARGVSIPAAIESKPGNETKVDVSTWSLLYTIAPVPAKTAPKVEPKPAAAAKPAPKKEAEKPAVTADAVQEEISAVDDEIVFDLYGKEHLNVVFMGHVGRFLTKARTEWMLNVLTRCW